MMVQRMVRKNFLKSGEQWHRLRRELVESLLLEVAENCRDVAVRDMVEMGWWLGYVILVVFSKMILNDSMMTA